MKKILLLEPDKEQAELFSVWLKEENYEVKALPTPDEAADVLSKDTFDLLIMDIDAPEVTDKCFNLCQTLKKDAHTQDLPTTVLTYKKDAEKITGAIEVGADSFVLKPFETDSFLERIKVIFKEIELKEQGKKVLDLNHINYLLALTGDLGRERFFRLSPVIFNKLIIEKINTILGPPIITQMIKRVNETIGVDYEFMKSVEFSDNRLSLDNVEKASKEVPIKKITNAFRDYVYAFLHLVNALTSDILMERGTKE